MDIDTWTDNKRDIVAEFRTVQTDANIKLDSNVAAFQAELAELTAAETEFAQEMKTLAATLEAEAIDETLGKVVAVAADVDAAFATLSELIAANNEAAAQIAAAIVTASKEIKEISETMTELDDNVASYRATIASFRSVAVSRPVASDEASASATTSA